MAGAPCAHPSHFFVGEQPENKGQMKVRLGCGLESTPTGIAAAVADWDGDLCGDPRCDIDEHATPIYCSPSGGLKGPPRPRTVVVNQGLNDDGGPNVPAGGSRCFAMTNDDLDLRTWCVNAAGTVNIAARFQLQLTAGDDVRVRLGYSLDGAAFDFTTVYAVTGSRAGIVRRHAVRPITFGNLAHGDPDDAEGHSLRVRVCVDNLNDAGGIDIVEWGVEAHGMLTSRQSTPLAS